MTKLKLYELTPEMSGVAITALISHVTQGKNNKSIYLNLQLQDRTRTIEAKLWNATQEQVTTLTKGVVVDVVGDVIKYNDELQMKITKISTLPSDPEQQLQYLKSAPLSREDMDASFREYLAALKNPTIKAITEALYEDYREDYLIYPAASKNHHEFVSGLAYHTLCMLQMAKAVALIHPELETDYLYAGIMLHDLGKVLEFTSPILADYSLQGKLVGHISIASALIHEKAAQLQLEGEEEFILQHLVLSHHGKQEYGSPVLPLIREAEVIYLIDNLDSRIQMINKALDMVEDGEFTKRNFALDNRSFYKPNQK